MSEHELLETGKTKDRTVGMGPLSEAAYILSRFTAEQLDRMDRVAKGEILALEPPVMAQISLPGDIVGRPVLSTTGRVAAAVECSGEAPFQAVVATDRLGCYFRVLKSGVLSIKRLRFADCNRNSDPAFTYEMNGKTHFAWGDWELTDIALLDSERVVDMLIDVGASYYTQVVFLIHHHGGGKKEYSLVHHSQSGREPWVHQFDAGYRPRAFSCSQQKDKNHPRLIGLFDGIPCWLVTNNYDGSKSYGTLFWGKDRRSSQLSKLRRDSFWHEFGQLTFVAYHEAKCRTCIFTLDRDGNETVQDIGPRDILVAHSQGNYFWPGDDKWPEQTTRLHSSSDTWSQYDVEFVCMDQLIGDENGGVYAYRFSDPVSLANPCILQHFDAGGNKVLGYGSCQFHARWIRMVGSTLMAAHNQGVVKLDGHVHNDPVLPPRNVKLKDMVEVIDHHKPMILAVKSEGPRTIILLRYA